jgi:LDH2 family malate/lactate/ureidoglycolate dehydrogenase
MPRVKPKVLRRLVKSMFEAAGIPAEEAEIVANHLVRSNLYGHDSHGVVRTQYYLGLIGEKIIPGAKVEVVQETVSTAVLDGHWGFGQVTGRKAMEVAVEKARATGIGMVTLSNVFHTGRVGEYTEMALEHNMIGMAFGGGNQPQVVAPMGLTRVLGTNPLAISVPAGEERPFRLDMATSVVAAGKMSYYLSEGKPVPEGWILDSKGNPTTDPADFRPRLRDMVDSYAKDRPLKERGSLLPFGNYKGFNLGVFNEIMGAFLAEQGQERKRGGFIFIAIDVSRFRPVEDFKRDVDQKMRTIKASERRPGCNEILVAGDPEHYSHLERSRRGIPIGEGLWGELIEAADNLGVDVETILEEEVV